MGTVAREVSDGVATEPELASSVEPRGCGGAFRLQSLILGQVISVLITGTGAFSTLLAAANVDIPVTQSSLNYILLSFHFLWIARRVCREGLAAPVWCYALWAFCDVEANFLVVWAYQYTSIASVMLLDCFAIPCVMLLSYGLLGVRYSSRHTVACLMCVAGLGLTVTSDVVLGEVGSSPQGPAWFGDTLVLCGAALYGLSNVLQECLLKGGTRRCEALGMLGLWGTIVSCCQAALLERQALARCAWSPVTVLYLVGFQLCLFGMYVLTSAFLSLADAALFNLSLLTSDLYSVLFSWRLQHGTPSWLYAAAFATTVSGLAIYHSQPLAPTAWPAWGLNGGAGECHLLAVQPPVGACRHTQGLQGQAGVGAAGARDVGGRPHSHGLARAAIGSRSPVAGHRWAPELPRQGLPARAASHPRLLRASEQQGIRA